MSDIIGNALLDFFNHKATTNIITHSNITETDEIPLAYLFRPLNEMPLIEQKAIELAYGNVLDVGCGGGSHSLAIQNKKLTVTALDISPGAIEVTKKRGVQNTICSNIFDFNPNEKYDTIMVLMNGTGICGKLKNLALFLEKLTSLLNKGGQLLIDSSDIIYMFEDEEGEHWIDAAADYYGEVVFEMEYNNVKSEPFDWLYVDYNTLQRCAIYNNLNCELVLEGEHYDYLAKITKPL